MLSRVLSLRPGCSCQGDDWWIGDGSVKKVHSHVHKEISQPRTGFISIFNVEHRAPKTSSPSPQLARSVRSPFSLFVFSSATGAISSPRFTQVVYYACSPSPASSATCCSKQSPQIAKSPNPTEHRASRALTGHHSCFGGTSQFCYFRLLRGRFISPSKAEVLA